MIGCLNLITIYSTPEEGAGEPFTQAWTRQVCHARTRTSTKVRRGAEPCCGRAAGTRPCGREEGHTRVQHTRRRANATGHTAGVLLWHSGSQGVCLERVGVCECEAKPAWLQRVHGDGGLGTRWHPTTGTATEALGVQGAHASPSLGLHHTPNPTQARTRAQTQARAPVPQMGILCRGAGPCQSARPFSKISAAACRSGSVI